MERKVDLLNGNIRKALLKMALPLTLTAFISMTYQFVDMIWIGKIGTGAVAAVGNASFLMWLSNAFALIGKTGMGILASIEYGRGDREKIIKILKSGYLEAGFLGIIYTVIIYLIKNPYINFFGLPEEVSSLTDAYLSLVAGGFIFNFLNAVFSQAFHSLGDSQTPFKINSLGLLVNAVLDPCLIFGPAFFPQMGIRGAALATILAQLFVSLVFVYKMRAGGGLIGESLSLKGGGEAGLYKDIFKLGLPASLISSFHAFITIILNRFTADFGAVAVAVSSVGSNLESISRMTADGLEVAIAAFIGQNFGAGKGERLKEGMRESLLIMTSLGLFAGLFLFIFREGLFGLFFPKDREAVALGKIYLAIMALSQVTICWETGVRGILSGFSDTKTSSIISNILNLLRIPLSLLLMKALGLYGIRWAVSISSILKGLVSILVLWKKLKADTLLGN